MIDGFRYGFFGQADVPVLESLAWSASSLVVLSGVCLWMLYSGYKIRR
jgi:ABC-2 type transport system permease protein